MKLEMRAVPRYKEAEAYIQQRIANGPGAANSPIIGVRRQRRGLSQLPDTLTPRSLLPELRTP